MKYLHLGFFLFITVFDCTAQSAKEEINSVLERDTCGLRAAFKAAETAAKNGNHPFGAVLADPDGNIIMEAENTVYSQHDVTAHAEFNLIKKAAVMYKTGFLSRCTVYSSAEPCPMCSGTIYYANIGRLVYGLSKDALNKIIGGIVNEHLSLPCRDIILRGTTPPEVIGPMMEEEAQKVHLDFWKKFKGF